VNDTVLKEIPKVLLAFVVGLSGSAFGVGLVSWRDIALTGQTVDDLQRRVGALETLTASIATENSINSLARVDCKFLIDKLQSTLEKTREDISAIRERGRQ
jgi:hypothetical protein